jgi:hypothetical protein
MILDLTDEETVAFLREIDAIIANDRYFLSPRIQTLKAILANPDQTLRAVAIDRRPEATPRMKPKLGPPMTLDEAAQRPPMCR